jgi:AraC family transcriptional regulator, dual regulator of chb operon
MNRSSLAHLPPDHFCTYMHHAFENREPDKPHDHDFHELFWVEESQGIHWVNGRSILLKSGDLILIRASDYHAFSCLPEGPPLRLVNFAFHAGIWTHMRKRYFGDAAIFFSQRPLASRSYWLGVSQLEAMRHSAGPLRSGLRDRLHTEAFLLSVLALLKANHFQAEAQVAPRWIRETCIGIKMNRNFAGGMPALARLAKRSPEHVAREFRRYLGRTPTDVIKDARMSYAADRLATSDEDIAMIALDCGLENLGHFYRLFQGRYGCTPRGYRLRNGLANP